MLIGDVRGLDDYIDSLFDVFIVRLMISFY